MLIPLTWVAAAFVILSAMWSLISSTDCPTDSEDAQPFLCNQNWNQLFAIIKLEFAFPLSRTSPLAWNRWWRQKTTFVCGGGKWSVRLHHHTWHLHLACISPNNIADFVSHPSFSLCESRRPTCAVDSSSSPTLSSRWRSSVHLVQRRTVLFLL